MPAPSPAGSRASGSRTRQSVEQLCAALRLGPRERIGWLVAAGYVPEQGTVVIENGRLVALLGLPAEEGTNGATP